MRESILSVLARSEIIVSDGAIGTQLQACGIPPGVLSEVWNAERPEVLLGIHRAYLAAGARIATTNTFGGNRFRLREAGLEDRHDDLNRRGVVLAREAVGDAAWVGGSLGPSGQLLEPFGTLRREEVEAAYAEQARVLAEAGVDLLLVETQHDIEEACLIVRAAKDQTGLPVYCTFAFDARGRTMMGLRPADAARRAVEAGAVIVGANCGAGPAAILAALEGMAGAATVPLAAKSNAGVPQVAGGETVWNVTPEEMAAHALRFVELGARIVGGCCGSGPEHIRAIGAAFAAQNM
jgi:5-methyltetrahydrofolate--homocysteine methyltransferase